MFHTGEKPDLLAQRFQSARFLRCLRAFAAQFRCRGAGVGAGTLAYLSEFLRADSCVREGRFRRTRRFAEYHYVSSVNRSFRVYPAPIAAAFDRVAFLVGRLRDPFSSYGVKQYSCGRLGSPDPSGQNQSGGWREMLWIPAGAFLMGDEGRSDNPRRTVTLDGYWIYKAPVTVAQFRKFCNSKPYPYDWDKHKPIWGWQDSHPMVRASWEDAKAYSGWAGVRLPSESEWEKAARGTDVEKVPLGRRLDCQKMRESNQ